MKQWQRDLGEILESSGPEIGYTNILAAMRDHIPPNHPLRREVNEKDADEDERSNEPVEQRGTYRQIV